VAASGEPVAQSLPAPCKTALHRPDRAAELPGRFRMRLPFQAAEHGRRALAFRQRIDFGVFNGPDISW
jgi:hypothetical protein